MLQRQTSEQIDRGIIDTASHTFATHGYTRTSVKQLADIVGYSKAGLLHRFVSKQALYDATVAATSSAVEHSLAAAAAIPAGAGRAVAMLEAIALLALERPGLVELLLDSTRPGCDGPRRDELHAIVICVLENLAGPDADNEHRLRTVLALRLIVDAVLAQDHEPVRLECDALHRLIIELAAGVLGVDPQLFSPDLVGRNRASHGH